MSEVLFQEYPKVVYKSRDEFKTVNSEDEEIQAETEGFGTFKEKVMGQLDNEKVLKNENRELKEKLASLEGKGSDVSDTLDELAEEKPKRGRKPKAN